MAQDKSKEEIKAEIIEEEAEDTTVKQVKKDSPRAKKKIEKAEKQLEEVVEDTGASVEDAEEVKAKDQFTKAGKRSKKATEKAEAKEEKETRKEAGDTTPQSEEAEERKKGPKPKVRPLVERRGKKYQEAAKKIEANKEYELAEAVKLTQATATTKFDGSVELHIRLNVDPKKADQNIRGSLVLPNGTGKTQRVAVFASEEDAKAAKAAGADISDSQALAADLEKGTINFDVLIATPDQMAKLGKFAKNLGPKGLMPNPKSGTVTKDVAKAVKEAKAGKVEYRVDRYGIIHLSVGKVSFKADDLTQNIQAIFKAVREARPNSIKGDYVRSISVSSSMGPGISVTRSLAT